jgi:hypothetical protein
MINFIPIGVLMEEMEDVMPVPRKFTSTQTVKELLKLLFRVTVNAVQMESSSLNNRVRTLQFVLLLKSMVFHQVSMV